MSDDRSVSINLHESVPLVQSSNSLSNSNGSNNHNLSAATSGNGGSTATTPTSNSGGGTITIQTSLPASNSFVVGTKANQSFISDAPVTDPGGSTTKQVIHVFLLSDKLEFLFAKTICFFFSNFSFAIVLIIFISFSLVEKCFDCRSVLFLDFRLFLTPFHFDDGVDINREFIEYSIVS